MTKAKFVFHFFNLFVSTSVLLGTGTKKKKIDARGRMHYATSLLT